MVKPGEGGKMYYYINKETKELITKKEALAIWCAMDDSKNFEELFIKTDLKVENIKNI